jgi:E1A/CREB-binding protein
LRLQDKLRACDLFDARTAYLSRCQEQNLQFDTLRRAKHSSMMTLFHLHNPEHATPPTACAMCQNDVVPGTGWKCETCAEGFEVCANCYHSGAASRQHPHRLVVRARLLQVHVAPRLPAACLLQIHCQAASACCLRLV